jgi:archaemetzincin
VISPIDEADGDLHLHICEAVSRAYGCRTEVLPLMTDLAFAYNPTREQYLSTAILERLGAASPQGALRVLGLTKVDLYLPVFTHVFGEAHFGGVACVLSTHRLREGLSAAAGTDPYYRRVAKEAVHELGHTFHLRHCREQNCIMHYCRSIQDVDRKSDQLCRYCRVLLADEMKRLGEQRPPAS